MYNLHNLPWAIDLEDVHVSLRARKVGVLLGALVWKHLFHFSMTFHAAATDYAVLKVPPAAFHHDNSVEIYDLSAMALFLVFFSFFYHLHQPDVCCCLHRPWRMSEINLHW